MRKAIVYTRFSPRRNADQSESCEVQKEYCEALARAQGYEIVEYFEDRAKSGGDFYRPGLEAAVKSLKRGYVLLVYKRDRLARDVLLAELTRRQVRSAGATIEAAKGDMEGDDAYINMVRQVLDAVAELERKMIGERTRDAMRHHQKNGRKMSLHPPYGMKPDPTDDTMWIENEHEQVAVRRIAELANEDKTASAIMNLLNDEMPERARTGKWNPKTVSKIMVRIKV